MTLVILGLLLGLVGIVWMVVVDIVSADRQCHRPASPQSGKLLTRAMDESKEA